MRRPRIKRTTEEIETPEGDIYLLRPSSDNDIRIEQPDAEERRLLAAVNGERTLEELRAEFGAEEVDDLIAQLLELEVVEDAADDERVPPAELERFDRQLRYFSDVGTGGITASECQDRLREAKVAVLGVGGLGGWSALALACTGVGEMWLIDGDRVEVSNLNRQIQFSEADVGELKVERAAARLKAFNSSMKVTTEARRLESEEDIAEFIAGSDVVIDAADWPAHDIERWCNAASFAAGIPYITMSHFPPIARVGPLYVPGKTGCFICQEIGYRREYPLFDIAVEQRRAKPSPAATLGPACGLIGGQVAMETMHLLTGLSRPSTQGVAQIYDLRTMEVKREPVVPEPECPICGEMPHEEVAVGEEADG
ncbi:MAG TPA: TOMM precursor leader peptide-binding protein [Solirubrobacterales bacterium]|nr:TOMM precursor leader peptide-binding protein [Solirubrobacterales bacterium]